MNDKIHNSRKFKPLATARRTYRSTGSEEKNYLWNNFHINMDISKQQNLNLSEDKTLFEDDSIKDQQTEKNFDDHKEDEEESFFHLQNDIFSNKLETSFQLFISKQNTETSEKINKQDTKISKQDIKINRFYLLDFLLNRFFLIFVVIVGILYCYSTQLNSSCKTNTVHAISQFKSLEEIKANFYNQESDIWNDISSAINETKSRNPKIPQIILLFANETTTMNCLATALADVSSNALCINKNPLHLNPENFEDDAGVIIERLKKYSETKNVMIISNILNINAEGIKALHNLCDKENPLIREVLYIFTMQTNNYQSSQQKLKFVEDQFYHKLSKNIDRDTLGALVTRITDAAIISVQPEPHLIRYC